MTPLRPSRRTVLVTAIGSAVWVGRHATAAGTQGDRLATQHAALAALCAGFNDPVTLGTACLRALPGHEASRQALTRALLADLRDDPPDDLPGARAIPLSVQALARAVRTRSRDDFANGRVISVQGWILSLTETRVYALAVLLAASSRRAEMPDRGRFRRPGSGWNAA